MAGLERDVLEQANLEFQLFRNVISTFLLLFMPVVIGLALAERVNQFKKEALEKLKNK